MTRKSIASLLFTGGLALVLAPLLFAGSYPAAAATSSTVIGAVMALAAVGMAYGSLELWSCAALGLGAWSFVAPVLLSFSSANPGFWVHMFAGLLSMSTGVAGHELIARIEHPGARS